MFMRTGPSEQAEADEQLAARQLVRDDRQADRRRTRASRRRRPASGSTAGLYTAAKAKKAGIIDTVQFRQDFVAELKAKYGEDVEFDRKYGKKKRDEIDLSSPFGVFKLWARAPAGPVEEEVDQDGRGDRLRGRPDHARQAGAEPLRLQRHRLQRRRFARRSTRRPRTTRSRPSCLRVDSPGGSATASEIILDATKRVKAKKPLVVSMGDVAGSGGYYVACGSDTIFADADDHHRLDRRGGREVRHHRDVEQDRRHLADLRTRGQLRPARLHATSSPSAEREQMRALMDEIYDDFKGARRRPSAATDSRRTSTNSPAAASSPASRPSNWGWSTRSAGSTTPSVTWPRRPRSKDYEIRVLPKPKNFMEQLLSRPGRR